MALLLRHMTPPTARSCGAQQRPGHNGGIITYMAKGKQYVAVMTGWGSLVSDGYGDLWGEPWVSMPKDSVC